MDMSKLRGRWLICWRIAPRCGRCGTMLMMLLLLSNARSGCAGPANGGYIDRPLKSQRDGAFAEVRQGDLHLFRLAGWHCEAGSSRCDGDAIEAAAAACPV